MFVFGEAPPVLRGQAVQLEPYAAANRDEVRAALDCDPDAWDLFALCGAGEHFDLWWDVLQTEGWQSFAIRRLEDGRVVGTSSFLDIRPAKLTVEIGATFLHPDVRGGAVNPDAKRVMLAHAFEQGARRVELKTDARNVRSQAAIAAIGATREGRLRRERTIWTGHIRDTILFSITDLDWPSSRALLDERLAAPRG